jgi:hypothetical protein
MLRNVLWLSTTLAAVITTVAVSSHLQASLDSSFPYPTKTALLGAATSEQLRERLGQEPLQAAVLRELAAQKDSQFELLTLSQKVSRRDPLAQLLLIEQATDQGDIATALEHYAVLLAISPGMQRGIIDLLGKAAHEPEIFKVLANYRNQAWFPAVMNRMATETATGEAILNLLKARPTAKEALTAPDQIGTLISLMLAKPDPQHAFALLELQSPRNSGLAYFGFSPTTLNGQLAPITWKLTKNVVPLPDYGEDAVALQVTALPNVRTSVAERFTALKPGNYHLAGTADVSNAPKLQIQWDARCKGDGAASNIINKSTSPSLNGGKFEMYVTLPDPCPVQHWQLAILGDDARLTSIVTIREIRLEPVN